MKLSPQHHLAIQHLAMGENNKSVAEKLNLAPESISRWRGDLDFQAVLNSVLAENRESTKDRLRHLSAIALETIEAIMTDSEAPAKDRLTAALKVIELSNISVGRIGSNDAAILRKEKAQDDFMLNIGL